MNTKYFFNKTNRQILVATMLLLAGFTLFVIHMCNPKFTHHYEMFFFWSLITPVLLPSLSSSTRLDNANKWQLTLYVLAISGYGYLISWLGSKPLFYNITFGLDTTGSASVDFIGMVFMGISIFGLVHNLVHQEYTSRVKKEPKNESRLKKLKKKLKLWFCSKMKKKKSWFTPTYN